MNALPMIISRSVTWRILRFGGRGTINAWRASVTGRVAGWFLGGLIVAPWRALDRVGALLRIAAVNSILGRLTNPPNDPDAAMRRIWRSSVAVRWGERVGQRVERRWRSWRLSSVTMGPGVVDDAAPRGASGVGPAILNPLGFMLVIAVLTNGFFVLAGKDSIAGWGIMVRLSLLAAGLLLLITKGNSRDLFERSVTWRLLTRGRRAPNAISNASPNKS